MQKFIEKDYLKIIKQYNLNTTSYKLRLVGWLNSDKIIVDTIYGLCYTKTTSLKNNHKPRINMAINKDEFAINKSKEIHGGRYGYSFLKYQTAHIPMIITCAIHGNFKQSLANHLAGKGCLKCGIVSSGSASKKSSNYYISKFRKKHGDRYIYNEKSLINKKAKDKIIIICKKHGVFTQTMDKHSRGNGCPKCMIVKSIENGIGWSHSTWIEAGKKSKNFDSYKVYLLEFIIPETNEIFYKVGKTFRTVAERFYCSLPKEYKKYKLIGVIEDKDAEFICKLEIYIFKSIRESNIFEMYTPKIEFGGSFEIFKRKENI